MPTGIDLIAAERQRQIDSEGFDEPHDDQHRYSELALAAACYATPPLSRTMNRNYNTPVGWPFGVVEWKPSQEMNPAGRIKELTKAGALVAAEIDRLIRRIQGAQMSPCLVSSREELLAKQIQARNWTDYELAVVLAENFQEGVQVGIAFGASPMAAARPIVVCLCGSTKFYRTFQRALFDETIAGKIVLTVGCFHHSDTEAHGRNIEQTEEQHAMLCELHKRKIDMADEILVLNVGGYVGESLADEIKYAQEHGKVVRWLEEPK